jgi:elongation factor Ts
MEIDPKLVAQLRQETGAGMMDCKKALSETGGSFDKAKDHLRKRGMEIAEKKGGRETKNGWIGSYIHHNGRVGVMVEVLCETDFVAKTAEFQELVKDLCMHIAMTDPLAVRREDISPELVEKEREIYAAQVPPDKPAAVREKILQGKVDSFFKERCLLEQPFIKDPKVSIKDLIQGKIQKTGENILLRRFARFEIAK